MILSAGRVAEELLKAGEANCEDPLIIVPLPNVRELRDSGAASIDLRLGSWFVTLRNARMSHLEVDDQEPQMQLTKTHYVPFGHKYFLHPQGFVLGVTLEWVCLPKNLAAYVIGRSSWGRRGLVIATATGVHPGFRGCLTLEMRNLGEIPISIKPGMTICQLFFHQVQSTAGEGDRSMFLGRRRPTLGRVRCDQMAERLAR
ncbi:MAG: dCTP deaminase [Acidobacteriota bacterium]